MEVKIEESWKKILADEFSSEYFKKLQATVEADYLIEEVFPPQELIFNAFNQCPISRVKVVILGQDPYHSDGQAMGLSFSAPDGVKIPPSLQNIYKEISADLGIEIPESGDLTRWAEQGVLLLNATLTVRAGCAGSHQDLGWEQFTDMVIKKISEQKEHVIFLLWGNYARSKKKLIDTAKHLVLEAPHPSPLSAHRGFLGCKHFSKTNAYLESIDQKSIVW